MRMLNMILIVIGAIVALLFIFADVLGLGNDPDTIGGRQIGGTVFGLAISAIGMILRRRSQRAESEAP